MIGFRCRRTAGRPHQEGAARSASGAGKEKSTARATLRLAVRNAARPSRILRCVYKIPSFTAPERELLGFIRSQGGEVLGATVLTGKPYSAKLAPNDAQMVH